MRDGNVKRRTNNQFKEGVSRTESDGNCRHGRFQIKLAPIRIFGPEVTFILSWDVDLSSVRSSLLSSNTPVHIRTKDGRQLWVDFGQR